MDTQPSQSHPTEDATPFWAGADYTAHFSAEEIQAIRQTHDQAIGSLQSPT